MFLKTFSVAMMLVSLSVSPTPVSRQALLLDGERNANNASCSLDVLPTAVRRRLNTEYSSWKIQDVFNLSASARRSWEYKKYGKPSRCPGIATGTFENESEAYAVLLVPRARPERAYRFLVFSSRDGEPASQLTTIEAFDDGGAENLFIRSVRISDLFNTTSRKKLGIAANEGVVIVESGKDELWTDVFFWTKHGYHREATE
jgi:hypothetical protein